MKFRQVALARPLDLRAMLKVSGLKGPSLQARSDGLWRATRTPEGPATVRLSVSASELRADAWGAGADWALEHVDQWIGNDDDPDVLTAQHPAVAEAIRAGRGMRLASVGSMVEVLIPTILAQKVTGIAAGRSYRHLVARYGDPAPGPAGMRLPPDPERLAVLPYYEFHPVGVEQKRAETIVRACRDAQRIEATLDVPVADACTYLHRIRGIGLWTTGSIMRIVRGGGGGGGPRGRPGGGGRT